MLCNVVLHQVKLQEGLYLGSWDTCSFCLAEAVRYTMYTCQCWPTMNQTRKIPSLKKEGGVLNIVGNYMMLLMSGVFPRFFIDDPILGCGKGKLETGTTSPKWTQWTPPKMSVNLLLLMNDLGYVLPPVRKLSTQPSR